MGLKSGSLCIVLFRKSNVPRQMVMSVGQLHVPALILSYRFLMASLRFVFESIENINMPVSI